MNSNKPLKKILYIFVSLLSLYLVVRFSDFDKNERLLNYLAKQYFDREYYLKEYPDVAKLNIDPFDHYLKYGWKEGKNPSKEFDTNFYFNVYLLRGNRHNLNPLTDYARANMLFRKNYTNSSQLNKVTLLEKPQYYLALATIFRDDARFLKEWIEFYRLVGVEHFYLYNNLSKDNYKDVLKPYIDQGIVELFDIKEESKNLSQWNKLQTKTYTEIVKKLSNKVEWLIIVDTDEFIFPVKEKNLKTVLKNYDQYPALGVNWKIFGSNNIQSLPADKLLIESMTGSDPKPDSCIKSIVKPRYVNYIDHPHFPQLEDGYFEVSENGEFFKGPNLPHISKNIIRLNHYWARDLDFFAATKLERIHLRQDGLTKQEKEKRINDAIISNQNSSSEYDDSIFKYIPELKKMVFNQTSDKK